MKRPPRQRSTSTSVPARAQITAPRVSFPSAPPSPSRIQATPSGMPSALLTVPRATFSRSTSKSRAHRPQRQRLRPHRPPRRPIRLKNRPPKRRSTSTSARVRAQITALKASFRPALRSPSRIQATPSGMPSASLTAPPATFTHSTSRSLPRPQRPRPPRPRQTAPSALRPRQTSTCARVQAQITALSALSATTPRSRSRKPPTLGIK